MDGGAQCARTWVTSWSSRATRWTHRARSGEILEVQGDDGAPPYVVKWADGHEGVMYPGADAHVVPQQRG